MVPKVMICGDVLAAVLVADVVEDLLAALLAEVDVDVGRLAALLVHQALEHQPVLDRIDVGDLEAEADERPGRAAASGAHGHAHLARVADEVGDDQEVRAKAHRLDDVHLVGQTLAGRLGRDRRRVGRGRLRQAASGPSSRGPEIFRVGGGPSGTVTVGSSRRRGERHPQRLSRATVLWPWRSRTKPRCIISSASLT